MVIRLNKIPSKDADLISKAKAKGIPLSELILWDDDDNYIKYSTGEVLSKDPAFVIPDMGLVVSI